MTTGLNSPIDVYNVFPYDYKDPYARYSEAQVMLRQGYEEQQQWLTAYDRAQRFGLSTISVQEINTKLFQISQRIENMRLLLGNAEEEVRSDATNNQRLSENITTVQPA